MGQNSLGILVPSKEEPHPSRVTEGSRFVTAKSVEGKMGHEQAHASWKRF